MNPPPCPFRKTERPGTRAICACGRSQLLPYCDGNHLGHGREPLMVEFTSTRLVSWCTCGACASFPLSDRDDA